MLVVNPAYEAVTEDWFDPDYWAQRARPVSSGGRGSAWFVEADQGDMVLRHYRRGGMVARISERRYLYTGESRARSNREFQLLETLHRQGLPVPEPVAAWSAREGGLWYRAAILIRRIESAVALPDATDPMDVDLWHDVGRTIRRFHDAGLNHVDLNCDNILVAEGQIYLIDFDRCRLTPGVCLSSKTALRNLDRLKRSVNKRFPEKVREPCWPHLLSGYQAST